MDVDMMRPSVSCRASQLDQDASHEQSLRIEHSMIRMGIVDSMT